MLQNGKRAAPGEAGQKGAVRGLQLPQHLLQLLGPQLLLQGPQRHGLAAPEVQLRGGSGLRSWLLVRQCSYELDIAGYVCLPAALKACKLRS